MGSFSSKINANILVVGLDNSGKTSILNQMKTKNCNSSNQQTGPTIGYNIDKFEKNDIKFTAFDMSGQYNQRELWNEFSKQSNGIIFVIDSSDPIRFPVAQNELECLLQSFPNKKIPILFFANKMDIEGSASANQIANQMDLLNLTDRSWNIQSSNAIKGEGIDAGLKWLSNKINMLLNKN